jgi:hypothetical protein
MHHLTKITAIAALLVSLFLFSACKEDSTSPKVTESKLSITSFTPASAYKGDTITVYGKNFDLYPDSLLTLTLGTNKTPILKGSKLSTEFKFITPTFNPGKYKLALMALNDTTIADSLFTLLYKKEILIASFSPAKADSGDTVTLFGENFDMYEDSKISLSLDNYDIQIIPGSIKSKELKFIIPNIKHGSYQLSLYFPLGSIIAPNKLVIAKVYDYSNIHNLQVLIYNFPTDYRRYYSSYTMGPPSKSFCDTVKGYIFNINYSLSSWLCVTKVGDVVNFRRISNNILTIIKNSGQSDLSISKIIISVEVIQHQDQYYVEYFNQGITLNDFDFIEENGAIIADVSSADLMSKLTSVNYSEHYQEPGGHSSSNHDYDILKLLPLTDSSRVRIKLY